MTSSSRRRLLTFGAIGVFNTVLDVSLFLLLRSLDVPIILANIISTSIALTGSYLLNRRYTFDSQEKTKRSLPLFVLVTAAGLWVLQPVVIHLVLIGLMQPGVETTVATLIDNPARYFELFAKLAASPATLTWNFLSYKYVVFKAKD